MASKMKIKVKTLPKNNKSELLIHVDYDADDDGNCAKNFTQSIAQGSTITVEESVGHAILAKYPKFVQVVTGDDDDGEGKAKNKMSGGAAKTA